MCGKIDPSPKLQLSYAAKNFRIDSEEDLLEASAVKSTWRNVVVVVGKVARANFPKTGSIQEKTIRAHSLERQTLVTHEGRMRYLSSTINLQARAILYRVTHQLWEYLLLT